ncbi:MAG: hypothetical protein U9N85_09640 [Bacteroidota bacterium]|nr:hypothetical protein [Bacteroidota bacterium]
MKRIFVLSAIIFFAFQGYSQKIEENSKKATKAYKDNIFSSAMSWDLYVGPSEGTGADILYGSSHNFTYGMKYIRNLSSVIGAGLGIHYQYQAFHIDQVADKQVPNSDVHDREILKMNNLGADVEFRFTLKRDKKKALVYIGIGGYGNWAYDAKHQTQDETDMTSSSNGYEYTTMVFDGLNYIEPLNYGVSARIGYKMFSLVGQYRMSDYFTSDFKTDRSDGEFPRLSLGLEFSTGR